MIRDSTATEPQIAWRELAGFRNVIVHGHLGVDLSAVWLVVEQDLPPLSGAVNRMATLLDPRRTGTKEARQALGILEWAGVDLGVIGVRFPWHYLKPGES
jgi:hypothetical protein